GATVRFGDMRTTWKPTNSQTQLRNWNLLPAEGLPPTCALKPYGGVVTARLYPTISKPKDGTFNTSQPEAKPRSIPIRPRQGLLGNVCCIRKRRFMGIISDRWRHYAETHGVHLLVSIATVYSNQYYRMCN